MSSDIIQALSKVPVLTGQANYREWALEIKAAARFANVWNAILGKDKAISTDAADVASFNAREEKAIGLITKSVSSSLKIELNKLQKAESTTSTSATTTTYRDFNANELWDHLKTKFEKKDGVSAIIDWGRLTSTKLLDDGTLEDQLNALQDLQS